MKIIIALALVAAAFCIETTFERQRVVDTVNAANTTWSATVYAKFAPHDYAFTAKLCGVKEGGPKLPLREVPILNDIPKSFDSRTAFSGCEDVISEIRDQSTCGSCWAFGATEAATDRWCIASKGQQKPRLSAEDLLSCCSWSCGSGCDGGYPGSAWQWFQKTGVVTGGSYEMASADYCNLYAFAKCDHHVTGKYGPCAAIQPTPQCVSKCDSGYGKTYSEDKHFFKSAYSVGSDPSQLQTELMTNGPIEVSFTVYSDFEAYKGGIYQHTTGQALGGHAVKMIGWGEENSVPYWIIANSWNNEWGEDGTFRIIRGQNECGIEGSGVAGEPKL